MCIASYWSSPTLGIASGRFRSTNWYKWSNGKSCKHLTHTRLHLLATLSGDDKVATPDFHQTLKELKGLKAMGCFGSWDSLDRAIQMLDPQSKDSLGDTREKSRTDDHPLTEVEVSAAGRRQQDIHYVNGMPLATTNGTRDSSR